MKMLLLSFAIFFVPNASSAPEDCSVPIPGSKESIELATQAGRAALVAEAQDIEKFCKNHVFKGVAALTNTMTADQAEFFKDNNKQCAPKQSCEAMDPWSLSIYPKIQTVEFAYRRTLDTLKSHLGGNPYFKEVKGLGSTFSKWDDRLDINTNAFTKLISKLPTPSPKALRGLKKSIKDIIENDDRLTDKRKDFTKGVAGKAAAYAECAKLTEKALSCATQIERVKELVAEKNGFYSLLPQYEAILTDKSYIPGLVSVAGSIMKIMNEGSIPQGDIFNDLKNEFKKSGKTERQDEDMAFNVLGVMASGGPNLLIRLKNIDGFEANPQASLSLAILAGALPALDVRASKSGHFYSYPPEVKTTCNNGKPYHFWMSAFLTHKLVQEGGDPEGAKAAVFLASKGYQAFAATDTRNPSRILGVTADDSFNHIMRMDLTYMAAGAGFGVSSTTGNKSKDFLVDEGLRKMLGRATFAPPLSTKESSDIDTNTVPGMLKLYSRFNELISPDTAFESFK